MQSSDIPSLELASMLPNDLIAEALDCVSEVYCDPDAALELLYTGVCSPPQPEKTGLFPSPQVVPLESRIHSYRLTRPDPSASSTQLKLSSLFRHIDFQAEVSTVMRQLQRKVALFPALQAQGVFSEALTSIHAFNASTAKPLLRAEAVSFTPTWEKENVNPNSC